jgi:acetyl esterase/lipase
MFGANRGARGEARKMDDERKRWTALRVLRWVLGGLLSLVAALALTVLVVANSQDGSVAILQRVVYSQWKIQPNTFEPRTPPRDLVRSDGLRVRTNVRYGTTWPNSFLDIWYAPGKAGAKRPTVIYMHGGGFFMGTKDLGDPMAGGGAQGGSGEPLEPLAKAGFNVVNLDYALAPAYRYPVPMRQLNDALGYLVAHADEYGLDMGRVIVMGGSAGAQMSAQYGVLLSDPAYAADVGIKPAIDRAAVKGLVLFSAPLKVSGFGWRMNAMMWAYLGTKDLETSRQARQVDLLSHLNADYPATYITDGNQADTFPEHAKSMDRILTAKHVDHVFNYYEPTEAKLGHGYTGALNTKYGRDNLEKAIRFIRQRTGEAAPS